MTSAQAADYLGVSKQNFHQSGLADAIDSWNPHTSVRLYSLADLANLLKWLLVRQGLIALRALHPKYPLRPSESVFLQAMEGQWTVTCPRCGGDGVCEKDAPGEGPVVWCSKCGIIHPPKQEKES